MILHRTHLFTAYAIDVTLSEDSYHRQNNDILFHRFARGNYWIIPTQVELNKGWLVPNPLKGLSLDRMPSLAASFDRDIISPSTNSSVLWSHLHYSKSYQAIAAKEITSLKIDLEKLKAESQNHHLQNKSNPDLLKQIKSLQDVSNI